MEPNATAPNAGITKAVDQVAKGLAVLYKECHKANPDGPECEAVMQLQKAVAEIDRMAGGDGEIPAEQSMEQPMDPGMDPAAMEPQQGLTFDQAGMQTAQMMQDQNAQRRAAEQAMLAGM